MKIFFQSISFLLASTLAKAQSNSTTNNNNTTETAQETPTCADDEELFRLQLLSGVSEDESWKSWGADASYRIFTESSSETHAECLQCTVEYPGVNVELCLPKDACHTALVGRNIGRWVSCDSEGLEELIMTWGNETLTRNNAYLFDRVDFGNGCEARCDAETETEFEFFLDRRDVGKQANVPFTWELNEVVDSVEKTAHLEGGIEAPYYQSAFVYESKCIPRSSCYEFTMGYPYNMTQSNETEFFDPSMYSVRFDGQVFGETNLRMGIDIDEDDTKLNETLHLGDSCKVDAVCNSDEMLIELEFKVNAEIECFNSDSNNFTYSSAIDQYGFGFWLKDQDIDSYSSDDYYVWSSGDYEGFEVGATYSSLACIPNDRCVKLYVEDGAQVTYKVYQDGVEMTQRVAHTEEDSADKGMVTTDLGDVSLCSSAGTVLKWSGGLLAIVAAGVSALLL